MNTQFAEQIRTHSFFGLFSYLDMDVDSCDYIYFSNVTLERSLGQLPEGWYCCDAYLDVITNELQFVKSWKPVFPSNPNYLKEDEAYTFQLDDLLHLVEKRKDNP